MKREKLDKRSAALLDELEDLPATKSPDEFTGHGLEIIGDKNKISGELWYVDGSCILTTSSSPAFEDLPPSKRPKIDEGKEACWFNMEQKYKLENLPSNINPAITRRTERMAMERAERLARAFADAMLKGELMPLIRKVEEEYSQTKKRREVRQNRYDLKYGIRDALAAIAHHSNHPDQVSVSAIVDFLKNEVAAASDFCKKYDITKSKATPREVRKSLESIGFGWIEQGRKRGRPSSKV